MKRIVYFVVIAFTLSTWFSATPSIARTPKYDIVIIGGRVVDPETGLDAVRNVGIKNNQITKITKRKIKGRKSINARGKIVSPGFIDMHAHGQTIPAARMQAMDGVTTALELESGVMPISDFYARIQAQGRPINYGASVNWVSARISAHMHIDPSNDEDWFFNKFKDKSWQDEVSTPAQLSEISKRIQHGLDEGGLGVGFLLGYAPGTGYKEYYQISEIAARANMPTYTHARYLSMLEPKSSFEAIGEIVSVAAGTGVQAHIVHLNSISLRDIDAIGGLISGAQSRGIKITTEAYPYGAGATGLGSALFRGDRWRERVGGVTAHSFDVDGKRLTEAEFSYLQREKPETSTIIHFLDIEKPTDKAFLDKSVLFPGGVIATDAGGWGLEGRALLDTEWPISEKARSHPRSAGTYAKFLSHYVHDTQAVSLIEAIERMSYRPAQILQNSIPQMKNKGRIQVGADADIVIFDLANVQDNASYAKPAQASTGFSHVIVNGIVLVENGVLDTEIMPGGPIRNENKTNIRGK